MKKDAFFKDAQRLQNHLTEVMALNTRDNLSYDADNSEEESEDYAQNNDLSSQSIDNNEDYQQL
jgi:hypothetical protein